MKTGRRVVTTVLFTLFASLFLLCMAILAYQLGWFHPKEIVQPPAVSHPTQAEDTTQPPVLPDNPIDFAAAQAKNPHIVAHIQIPGTVIDYPVLRGDKSISTDFYLTHNENGDPAKAGSIYIQHYNSGDFSDPNTIVYGHNMANGSMFSSLLQFRKADFFAEHEYIYVYTPGHILTYRIYSAFLYDNRHLLNAFDFSDEEDYAAYLEGTFHPASSIQQVREGVTVTTSDRLITLSTCYAADDERFLVHGVLVSDQSTK